MSATRDHRRHKDTKIGKLRTSPRGSVSLSASSSSCAISGGGDNHNHNNSNYNYNNHDYNSNDGTDSPSGGSVMPVLQRSTGDAKPYRHSFSNFGNIETKDAGVSHRARFNRRVSSFTSSSSPWARRRSFLSSTMISDEKHLVYELHSGRFFNDVPMYSISLKESQGFTWNQDLFASQYQQQSAVLYDTEEDTDNEDAIMMEDDDDDDAHDNDDGDAHVGSFRRLASLSRARRSTRRSYSYSASQEHGNVVHKVKVMDFGVTSDEDDE